MQRTRALGQDVDRNTRKESQFQREQEGKGTGATALVFVTRGSKACAADYRQRQGDFNSAKPDLSTLNIGQQEMKARMAGLRRQRGLELGLPRPRDPGESEAIGYIYRVGPA